MKPVLLFRKELASNYELQHAAKYFPIEESRVQCANRLVVGRYSVLPMYHELERDMGLLGSRLVNSYEQHRWISAFEYYADMAGFTPETWDDTNFSRCTHRGPFVVKGKMSSRKRRWDTHMFAKTKAHALKVGERLKEDGEIAEQGVVYRRYVPLKTFQKGPHGLPFTNEWRFYYLGQRRLSVGYYWSMADCAKKAELQPAAIELADKLAAIAARRANFFTLDLAETESGEWILIEINDGQTAVPSENDLDELYGNLRDALNAFS